MATGRLAVFHTKVKCRRSMVRSESDKLPDIFKRMLFDLDTVTADRLQWTILPLNPNDSRHMDLSISASPPSVGGREKKWEQSIK
jgi:hypothetical protein